MTTPDEVGLHMYENEVSRHRNAAHSALMLAKQELDRLLSRWDDEAASVSLLVSDARRAAGLAAEGYARAEAYGALHDVRFLTIDPDAEQSR